MLTKTTTSFLGLKRHGITLSIIALLFISSSVSAQDVWQKAKIYPGSQIVQNAAASFEEGWARNTQDYSKWFRFSDKQYRSPQTWEQVQPKVTKTYNFTTNSSGYLTFIFETHVAEEVFYHQDPGFAIYKLKDNGEWENMWLGFTVYSECFHGGKPTMGSNTNLFLYQINADNTLRYYTVPPLYQPGQYKIVIEAAKRVGAYDLAYVPCEANLQVYFIGKDARVHQGYDKPQPGILYYTEKECK